jgi:hypothetical protein
MEEGGIQARRFREKLGVLVAKIVWGSGGGGKRWWRRGLGRRGWVGWGEESRKGMHPAGGLVDCSVLGAGFGIKGSSYDE